ncbi:GlmU family protein [Robertkochia solimangrovi]|uniref:GlmU family protein n=1 Tax=Robertkochia solimangrovi TaxID=2213046 RepID=UPI00117CB5F9|nr:GlmU family protein [Robertkochia solimangrovi]TRZ43679.1 glucose-1-phosphate thymidylyltransferase [Robertkochia solimangrovi]
MNYILFDGPVRRALLPFTYTRPVADIRIGILTIREKWERYLGYTTTTITEEYLSEKYPMVELEENILINAAFLPNEEMVEMIRELQPNQAIFCQEEVIAFFTTEAQEDIDLSTYEALEFEGDYTHVENTWDIFTKNGEALEADFELITAGRRSQPISPTNNVINPENIFLEEGAVVEFCTLNASDGPIYIGKDALVMEGCMIRNGFSLGEKGLAKMGGRFYGPSTFGPHCKIGGEINNVVMFAYSNKGHDGFLGNSVVGEWCNFGADTNSSNMKNNYAEVRLWDYETERFARTGLQFCGLMMGDHSKCGINTMFNTGTVIGVSANIFGSGFPRNFIPSFSWGGASGFTPYLPVKAYETARAMMGRRGLEFTDLDKAIMDHVFEESAKWRKGT